MITSKSTSKKMAQQRSNKDYEKLGRMLASVYESGYLDKNKQYKSSFLKGLVGGFGGVLGATILIGLLLWTLTFFQHVPLVGPFIDHLKETVRNKE